MSKGPPWDLLVRHAAGRLTALETDQLARWSGEAAERAQLVRRVCRLVEVSRAADAVDQTSEAWQRFERRLAEQGSDARVLHVRLPLPPTARAPLVSSRAGRASAIQRLGLIAAAAMLVLGLGLGSVWRWRTAASPAMRDVVTRRGERLELGLPDGSRVMLGPASRLRLVADGFPSARRVMLEGTAYFTVAHDLAHPFVVLARGSATQAVGTAFGVRAYSDDAAVQVAVAEGRVLFRGDTGASGTGTPLDRNSVGTLDSDGRVTVRRGVELERYLGWTSGDIRFERVPLAKVLRELGRMYGVDIVLVDSASANIPVTAVFRDRMADDVARALADIVDMHLRREADGRLLLQPVTPNR